MSETIDTAKGEQQTRGDVADRSRASDRRSRDERPDDHDEQPTRRWPLIVLGIVVVLAIIAGVVYWLLTRDLESTDDAYTEGNAIAYAAKVSGYVTQLNVDDNTFVHAGDLLLKIDQRDYITARDQAAANLSLTKAQLASAQVDLDIARVRVPATLQQAQAQLQQAQANRSQAERDYRRQRAVDQGPPRRPASTRRRRKCSPPRPRSTTPRPR